MNRWLKGVSIFVFLLFLTACVNDSDDTEDAVDPEGSAEEIEQNKEHEMTIEALLNKAEEAAAEVESMHADIDMEQKIFVEQLEMNSVIEMQMDVVTEPLSMYQQMIADVEGLGQVETEIYMVADGFYMKLPGEMDWMKFSNEDEFAKLLEGNMGVEDAQVDYAMLEEFKEDFQLEETKNDYVLSLSASGDRFNDFVKEQMASTGLEGDLDTLDEITVHGFSYKVFIDKETFQTKAFQLMMEIELATDEGGVLIEQDLDAVVSQINEIPEIVVPADVVDNAVSF